MSKTTFFKDLGKAGSDLLEKDFPTDSWSVEAESKAANDVKFKTTGARKADGSVSGSVEHTAAFKEQGTTVKATLKTDKTYSAEVTVEDKGAKGLKVVAHGESKGDKNTVKATVDYKNGSFGTMSTTFTYPFKAAASVSTSITTGYENFTVGGSADFAVDKKQVSRYALKFLYNGPSFKLIGSYNAKPGDEATCGVTYHHTARDNFDLVGEVTVDTAKVAEVPKLRFGTQWKRDAFTTVKSKLETDAANAGKLSFSVQQKLSDNATVVVGSESTLANLSAGGSHKVGATLKLNF